MRFGLVRLVLAGLVGFAVAGPIAEALAGPIRGGGTATLWFLLLAGATALVVAMVFLVVAEALVPSGSLPGPLELRRGAAGPAGGCWCWTSRSRPSTRCRRPPSGPFCSASSTPAVGGHLQPRL